MSVSIKTTRRASDQKVVRGDLSLYVSPTGRDTNNGRKPTTPFKTIQKAFDYIRGYYIAEDATVTINLAAGIYSQANELVMDHPQGNLITLRGPAEITRTAQSVSRYTDTTQYNGVVNRLSYTQYVPFLDSEVGANPTSGSRFINTITYSTNTGVPRNTSGTYLIITPHDQSTGTIDLQHNMNSLGNYSSYGFSANSTAPDRYLETESSMRRFFSLGGFKIKTNRRDSVGANQVIVENYRNRNPYDGVSNTNTGRVHTFSDPSSSTYDLGGNTGAPSQYISAVISVTNKNSNGIRITKDSSLKVEYLAVETRDPSTGNVSSGTGILTENNSSLVLGTGVVVKNFKVGIGARNKSLIRQDAASLVYNSSSYCGTGVLISENSQATLKQFVSNGSWERGYVVNQQSEGTFTDCVAVGSGSDGFVATRNSNLVCLRCVSAYNFQDAAHNYTSNKQGGIGFGSRLNSNAECTSCLSFRNGFGYFSDKNSSINLSGCDSTDNINRGFSITECSSGVLGPFLNSHGDAVAINVGDNSFGRSYVNTYDFSGLDPANGLSAGNAITVTTNSCLNIFDCQLNSFGNNAVQTMYNSSIVADNLGISGSGFGDHINCTYDSTVRCSNSTVTTSSIYTTALQPGYAEVNGVAY